jgi:hypothetical protein
MGEDYVLPIQVLPYILAVLLAGFIGAAMPFMACGLP